MGSGTTAVAAHRLKRHFIGFEINPDYCEVIRKRLADESNFNLEIAPIASGNGKPVSQQPSLFGQMLTAKTA